MPDYKIKVKTANGQMEEVGLPYVNKNQIVGTTGQNTTDVMSQKSVTDELNAKANKFTLLYDHSNPSLNYGMPNGIKTLYTYQNNQIANLKTEILKYNFVIINMANLLESKMYRVENSYGVMNFYLNEITIDDNAINNFYQHLEFFGTDKLIVGKLVRVQLKNDNTIVQYTFDKDNSYDWGTIYKIYGGNLK